MTSYRDMWARPDERESYGEYTSVRESLSTEYASLPDETIESLIESLYPGADPEDVENLFKSLKNAGKAVAKIGQKALPGMIQGATTGMALGPWGALAGGLAGGALSAASGGGKGRRGGGMLGSAGRMLGGIAKNVPRGALAAIGKQVPGLGAVAGLAGSPAAAQLLSMLNQPAVGQALRSLAMGGAGKPNVNVGGMSIPNGAITTTLRQLLERVETEMHELSTGESNGTPRYLLNDYGEFAVDPTDESARAERVMEILAAGEAFDDDSSESDDERYYEAYAEDDEYSEDDEISPGDQARILYPGVYESTLEG